MFKGFYLKPLVFTFVCQNTCVLSTRCVCVFRVILILHNCLLYIFHGLILVLEALLRFL